MTGTDRGGPLRRARLMAIAAVLSTLSGGCDRSPAAASRVEVVAAARDAATASGPRPVTAATPRAPTVAPPAPAFTPRADLLAAIADDAGLRPLPAAALRPRHDTPAPHRSAWEEADDGTVRP